MKDYKRKPFPSMSDAIVGAILVALIVIWLFVAP